MNSRDAMLLVLLAGCGDTRLGLLGRIARDAGAADAGSAADAATQADAATPSSDAGEPEPGRDAAAGELPEPELDPDGGLAAWEARCMADAAADASALDPLCCLVEPSLCLP